MSAKSGTLTLKVRKYLKKPKVIMSYDGISTVQIPQRFKTDAPTSGVSIEDSVSVFEGTITYIYRREIFIKQITELFLNYFSLTINPEDIEYEIENNILKYKINDYQISSRDLCIINNKLTIMQDEPLESDYFPTKDLLMNHIQKTYQTDESLIIISRQITKIKNEEIKYVYDYTYFEKRDIDKLIKTLGRNRNLYEVISNKYSVKPYFDIEIEGNMQEDEQREKLKKFLDFLKIEIKQIYEIHLDDNDIVILDSCTFQKLSYHIIINNKIKFENLSKHKEFVIYLIARLKNPLNEEERSVFESLKWEYQGKTSEIRYIIDSSVYNDFRSFRLVNQSKKNKLQTLKLISNHKIIDTFVQYDANQEAKMFLETCRLSRYYQEEVLKQKNANSIERKPLRNLNKKKDKEGNYIEESFDQHITFIKDGLTLQIFKNMTDLEVMQLEPEQYRYLHVIPIQDNYEEWIKIGMALKSCNSPTEYWDEWSRLGKKYKEGECIEKYETFIGDDESKMIYSISTLKYLANKCKKEIFKGFLPIYNMMYKLNLSGIEQKIEDCFYLSECGTKHENNIFTDKRILILHAMMGGGKTTSIKRILKDNNYKSCLFFSTRQTFAHFVLGEFPEFHNYLNKDEEINNKDKIILSLESLFKLDSNKEFELIVCDEIETLLSIFSSQTLGSRTYETFIKFEKMLKKAKKVIMMDAFISNRTIHLCKGITNNDNIYYLKNVATRKLVKARKISYKTDESYPIILNNILEGKKIYMTFSSNRKLNEFEEYLKMKKDEQTILNDNFIGKIIKYNKDSNGETMTGLMNINETWKNASLILASPKITVGCSYNPDGDRENPDFDMKINYAVHSCTARDIFQSLMRVRNISEDGLFFGIGPSVYTNFEKNFLHLNMFNAYENSKRENIIKELRKRIDERKKNDGVAGRNDSCNDLISIVNYLEENRPIPLLREVLYYNSLEMNMSCRYFEDYYMTLLPQAGFEYKEEERIVEENDEKNVLEKIYFKEKTVEEMVDDYQKISIPSFAEMDELENKQKKNQTTKEENDIISKFYFELVIDNKTPDKNKAEIFYKMWMDKVKRKIIMHNYYYQKSYIEMLKKEIKEKLCTEKIENLAEKAHVLKEIERILEISHGDEETEIPIEKIKKCYDYLKTNHTDIHDRIFKIRDQSKRLKDEKIDESQRAKYCMNFINKIYKGFYGYYLKASELDSHTKSPKKCNFVATDSFKYKFIHIHGNEIKTNLFNTNNEDQTNK
jgi:hypothetical protein